MLAISLAVPVHVVMCNLRIVIHVHVASHKVQYLCSYNITITYCITLPNYRLQSLVPEHNLVIASYDIVRNDIEFFR